MHLEYKYLISANVFEQVKNEMLPYLVLDSNADNKTRKEYTVRSIYYDTQQYQYYFEKIEGIKTRKKVRIRAYNDYSNNKIVFLEIKRKNENYVSKNRAALLLDDLEKLLAKRNVEKYIISSNENGKAVEDANKFLFYYNSENLKPTILVTYEREPYFYKFDSSLRITFDKNLRFQTSANDYNLFEERNLQPALIGKVIIEVKFNNPYPHWLLNIFNRYSLQRKAISKYTVCLDTDKDFNSSSKFKKFALSNSSRVQLSIRKNITGQDD
jgi:SPX domain protein involved in polyphosphate accumulation